MSEHNSLQDIRESKGWRRAVWGLRLMLVGFSLMVVGILLLAAGVAGGGAAAGVGLATLFAGLPVALVGAATVTRRTSAYTGVSAGQPSPARMWQGVKAAAADVVSRRAK